MLGFFRGLFQPLKRQNIFSYVNARFFFKFRGDMLDYFLVKIIPAQMSVSAGCADFYCIVTDLQNRQIKSPAAKIINHDFFVPLFIEAVSQRSPALLL